MLDLRRAVARLSRRQREAVALHYRLGLSVVETAVAMGVTDGTVKTLLSRARLSLASSLGDLEDTGA
ncbi:MAG: sigma factor-like helix-turn-helix DNA-binding protein [Acidimicrobiales bacterium]